MTLKAICLVNLLTETSSPTKIARLCSNNSSMPSLPAPETDWYVATTTRLIFALSCKGFKATTICAVEQLGLAMMLRAL